MSESVLFDHTSYPLLLPHFGYHDDAVYFGPTRVAPVAEGEGWFLDRCDGSRTFADALTGCNFSADFIAGIAHWLIWWPEPVASTGVAPRQSVDRLILCARTEVPWTAMGGTIIGDAADHSTLVQCAFQMFTGGHRDAFRTTRELALACDDEAATAARLAGVEYDSFTIPQHEARRVRGIEDAAAFEILQSRIAELIVERNPAKVYVGAALDDDPDTALLQRAVLSLLGDGVLDAALYLYEDVPALIGERQIDDFVLQFENAFLESRSLYRDITPLRARKAAILEVFQCRLDAATRHTAGEHAAVNSAVSGFAQSEAAERLFEIAFAALE